MTPTFNLLRLHRPSGCVTSGGSGGHNSQQKDSPRPAFRHLTRWPGDRVSFCSACVPCPGAPHSIWVQDARCREVVTDAPSSPQDSTLEIRQHSRTEANSCRQHTALKGAHRKSNRALWQSLSLLESGAMDSTCRRERLTRQLARSAPAVARVWAVYQQQFMKSCLKRWVPASWDVQPLYTALMHSSMDPVQPFL